MDIINGSVYKDINETKDVGLGRYGRQLDLSGAASGYGGGGYCCDTGVDLPTLLALLAGKLLAILKDSRRRHYFAF